VWIRTNYVIDFLAWSGSLAQAHIVTFPGGIEISFDLPDPNIAGFSKRSINAAWLITFDRTLAESSLLSKGQMIGADLNLHCASAGSFLRMAVRISALIFVIVVIQGFLIFRRLLLWRQARAIRGFTVLLRPNKVGNRH
jgi:hypothetical protein